jgi:polyphosphate kinase 2 (PPK2 family)
MPTAIAATSAEHAPWYVIPGDRKWYRNLIIAGIVRETLGKLELKFPPPAWDLSKVVVP